MLALPPRTVATRADANDAPIVVAFATTGAVMASWNGE